MPTEHEALQEVAVAYTVAIFKETSFKNVKLYSVKRSLMLVAITMMLTVAVAYSQSLIRL